MDTELDRTTPNYIVTEETKMRELRLEAVKRALKYEEATKNLKKKLVVECLRELDKEEIGSTDKKWKKRRKEMRNKMKINKEELENRREKGETRKIEELLEKVRGKERIERVKNIKESN